MKQPFHTLCVCEKMQGGKKALWHARLRLPNGLVGAGNTADNAIKDLRKQVRIREQVQVRELFGY